MNDIESAAKFNLKLSALTPVTDFKKKILPTAALEVPNIFIKRIVNSGINRYLEAKYKLQIKRLRRLNKKGSGRLLVL